MSRILIIYYSRKGQNYWNGSIKNLKKGNTEIVAEMIRDAVGGDLFEVDTVEPYSDDYTACTEEARQELHANVRPELKKYMDSLEDYDTIFVGYDCVILELKSESPQKCGVSVNGYIGVGLGYTPFLFLP